MTALSNAPTPDLAGRPQLIKGNRQILFGGMGRLTENSVVNIKNKSHAVTAEVVVPAVWRRRRHHRPGGVIGGWSLYAKDGKLKYCYNFFGVQRYTVEGTSTIPTGTHQVRMEFAYDGGGLAKGGTVCFMWMARRWAKAAWNRPSRIVFSADETCDVGNEFGSPVTYDYPASGAKFSGEVNWVEIDIGKDAVILDHLISPEQRLHVAMAIQ